MWCPTASARRRHRRLRLAFFSGYAVGAHAEYAARATPPSASFYPPPGLESDIYHFTGVSPALGLEVMYPPEPVNPKDDIYCITGESPEPGPKHHDDVRTSVGRMSLSTFFEILELMGPVRVLASSYRVVFVRRGHALTRMRRPLEDAQRYVVAPVAGPQAMIPLSAVLACVTLCCEQGDGVSNPVDVCTRLSLVHGVTIPDITPYLDALVDKGYITIQGTDVSLTPGVGT